MTVQRVNYLLILMILLPTLLFAAEPQRRVAPAPGGPLTGTALPAAGTELTTITWVNQWGYPATLDTSTQVLIYSTDKSSGQLVHKALQGRLGPELDRRHLLYAIDYGAVPGFVRWIIEPKIKGYSYPVALDIDSKLRALVPVQVGKATLVFLDNLLILDILYAESVSELSGLLE